MILLDKMNLFYVGMTRPESRLYAMNYHEKGAFGKMLHDQLLAMDLGMSDDGVIQIGVASAQIKKGIADDNLTTAAPHVIGKTTAMGNLCRIEVTYLGQ